jgi:hypothetical protein
MKVVSICRTTISALMAVCLSTTLGAQSESLQARVAALKESLTQSREQLKQYEWVETTVVLQNGEEKSTKQYRAHSGADGTVQKTLLETSPEKEGRGLRGHIIEKKKEELTDYMQRAVDLVKLYVPPSSEKIQAVKDAGNALLTAVELGRRVRLNFRNYQMPGDMLTIDLDPKSNRLLGATVSTYLDDPKDAVELVIQFGLLPDGATYPASVNLNAQAKKITVQVTNADYRKVG